MKEGRDKNIQEIGEEEFLEFNLGNED